MEKLSIGQVVLATFPFSDLTSTKLRPCLIIGIAEFNDVALCQITSKAYQSKRAVSLANIDFEYGSIVTSSYIRPDKIATLDKSMVKRVLGNLKNNKQREVKERLSMFLEIDN
jgi:mRNA-degrading endonuclease toxin of MazEF toxin-antitoxin module